MGNVNKHRYSISGVGKVVEEQKWGRDKAVERYGKLEQPSMKAKDMSYPQDPIDGRGSDWADDVKNDWRRGANEDATTKPGYVSGYRPKK